MKTPSSFRFNPWPVAIIAWFILFITFTVVIISYLSRQKGDLVRTDYYDDEIHYQEQLDRLNRTLGLNGRISVAYDAVRNTIAVTLPVPQCSANKANARSKVISGHIRLYRPANQSLDREIQLSLDPAGSQFIDAKSLATGLWKVRVYWTMDGQDYYYNQAIRVAAKHS